MTGESVTELPWGTTRRISRQLLNVECYCTTFVLRGRGTAPASLQAPRVKQVRLVPLSYEWPSDRPRPKHIEDYTIHIDASKRTSRAIQQASMHAEDSLRIGQLLRSPTAQRTLCVFTEGAVGKRSRFAPEAKVSEDTSTLGFNEKPTASRTSTTVASCASSSALVASQEKDLYAVKTRPEKMHQTANLAQVRSSPGITHREGETEDGVSEKTLAEYVLDDQSERLQTPLVYNSTPPTTQGWYPGKSGPRSDGERRAPRGNPSSTASAMRIGRTTSTRRTWRLQGARHHTQAHRHTSLVTATVLSRNHGQTKDLHEECEDRSPTLLLKEPDREAGDHDVGYASSVHRHDINLKSRRMTSEQAPRGKHTSVTPTKKKRAESDLLNGEEGTDKCQLWPDARNRQYAQGSGSWVDIKKGEYASSYREKLRVQPWLPILNASLDRKSVV